MKPLTMMTVSRDSVCTLAVVLLLVQMLLVLPSTEASCACKNGGKAYLPNNIFGSCRCLCVGGFKGPKCQFVRKRDGNLRLSELLDRTANIKRGGNDLEEEEDTLELPASNFRRDSLLSLLRLYEENLEDEMSALDM